MNPGKTRKFNHTSTTKFAKNGFFKLKRNKSKSKYLNMNWLTNVRNPIWKQHHLIRLDQRRGGKGLRTWLAQLDRRTGRRLQNLKSSVLGTGISCGPQDLCCAVGSGNGVGVEGAVGWAPRRHPVLHSRVPVGKPPALHVRTNGEVFPPPPTSSPPIYTCVLYGERHLLINKD